MREPESRSRWLDRPAIRCFVQFHLDQYPNYDAQSEHPEQEYQEGRVSIAGECSGLTGIVPGGEIVQDGDKQEERPLPGPLVLAVGDVQFVQCGVEPVDEVNPKGDDHQDDLHDHVPLFDVVSFHRYSPKSYE